MNDANVLVAWMKEPCSKASIATAGAYEGHVPYLVWTEGRPDHECMYCGARPGVPAPGVVVTARVRHRPLRPWRLRTWSGTVSYTIRDSGGEEEGMAVGPARDGLSPVRWRAFGHEALTRRLRRYVERRHREEIVEWTEVCE